MKRGGMPTVGKVAAGLLPRVICRGKVLAGTRRGSLVAGVAAVCLAIAPTAGAKTFDVTRKADTAPNGCSQGGCTLREAVIAANARAGRDVIALRAGKTYSLAISGMDDVAALGDLDVAGPLEIRSTGKRRASIDANDVDAALNGFASLKLNRIVVRDTLAAAIDMRGASLAMARSKVTDGDGLGVYKEGAGSIRLSRSVITGTIEGIAESDAGGVTLKRSRVSGNDFHGVIEREEGDIRAIRSRVIDNGGEGLWERDGGDVTVSRSVLTGNAGSGAFVNPPGTVRISRSTVAVNGGRGLSLIGVGNAAVKSSTISGNAGGGVFFNGSTARIVNSTIAGNTTESGGGGIIVAGGTILRLNAVTVARNVADVDGSGGAFGGGLFQPDPATISVENSLIALNEVGLPLVTGQDCYNETDDFDSGGNNILTDDNGCTGFDAPGDRVLANPKIGGLKDNGGPTKTVALKKGSPAIGKAGSDAPNRDQRGVKRRNPDIGAFER